MIVLWSVVAVIVFVAFVVSLYFGTAWWAAQWVAMFLHYLDQAQRRLSDPRRGPGREEWP